MTSQATLFSLQDSFPPVAAESVAMTGGNGGDENPIPIPIQDPGVDLVRKTVCIKVRLSMMGNTERSHAHV